MLTPQTTPGTTLTWRADAHKLVWDACRQPQPAVHHVVAVTNVHHLQAVQGNAEAAARSRARQAWINGQLLQGSALQVMHRSCHVVSDVLIANWSWSFLPTLHCIPNVLSYTQARLLHVTADAIIF
jgi:hypothetical protein